MGYHFPFFSPLFLSFFLPLEFGGRSLGLGLAAAGGDAVHFAAFGAMADGMDRAGGGDMTAADADESFLAGLAKHRTEFVVKDAVRTAH